MDPADAVIVISPVEEIDPELTETVRRAIEEAFGFGTREASLVTDIGFAHDANRGQYHSTPILEKLADAAPGDALKVLAVTREDLFIPILTHVYGEAQLGGRACIVSTNRLGEGLSAAPTTTAYLDRLAKEAVHELGHTFKLLHCKDKTCIMHYCRKITDVDRKSNDLCRYCKIMLGDEVKRIGREAAAAPHG